MNSYAQENTRKKEIDLIFTKKNDAKENQKKKNKTEFS